MFNKLFMGACKTKITKIITDKKTSIGNDIITTTVGKNSSTRNSRLVISSFYKNISNINEYYNILPGSLGKGSFAEVKKAYHIPTGTYRAVKIINKSVLSPSEQTGLKNEIQVLKRLSHPNIVKVFEFFENDSYLYISMELLAGGELFDKINKRKRFSEKKAATYFYQILSGVHYLHKHQIVHRDLKPENILFDDQTLKIVDFGTSKIYDANKNMKRFKGTPFYIAPEVLKGTYTDKCDVWSCGVILYIMLTGCAPFNGSKDEEIFNRILKGYYTLNRPEFRNVSQEAKDFIRRLLTYDAEERITIEEALNDLWFKKIIEAKEKKFDRSILLNIKKFNAKTKLQKAIYYFMANHMANKADEMKLIKTFQCLDANHDGILTKQELYEGFRKSEARISDSSISDIIERVAFDNKDSIEYNEFLAAAIDKEKLLSEDKIKLCFKMFDHDGNGKISLKELQYMFNQTILGESGALHNFFKTVKLNENRELDYDEFRNILLNVV